MRRKSARPALRRIKARKAPKHITRVPQLLKIGRVWWRVFVEPQTSLFRATSSGGKLLEQESDGGYYGTCEWDVKEIHLSRLVSKRGHLRDKILVHEILHAMLGPDDPVFALHRNKYNAEERLVQRLTPKFVQIMKQLNWKPATRG